MDNKERNEIILKLTCEFLDQLNFEVEKAFVEDVEGEENQVLVGVTVPNPANLIGFRGRNLAAIQLILSLMVKKVENSNTIILHKVEHIEGKKIYHAA